MDHFLYTNGHVTNSNSLLYTVNRAGCGELGADFHIKRNSLYPYSIIHYVVNGSGYVIWKGRKYDFHKGQLFILNPYEGHEYSISEGSCLAFNWIEFYGGDSERLMNYIINKFSPVVDSSCCEDVNDNILEIFKLLKPKSRVSIDISRLIYDVFATILDCGETDNMMVNSIDVHPNLAKAVEYIDSNLNKEVNVKMLAALCNYSPTYFSKLFIKVYGISASQYIIRKRIARAKELLINSDIQIEILAEKLGFCSPSHFIRSFRQCEGVTPSEYRKQNLLLRGKHKL